MYPLFASFVIFVIFLSWSLHRHKNDDHLKTEVFFRKERAANESRKKSIAELDYIQIPAHLLVPFEAALSNANFTLENVTSSDALDSLKQLYSNLESLSNKKILNLTGISNTDLKLSYGVANLTPLSAYDQNYTALIKTLHSIASFYYTTELPLIAKDFLEFSVQTKSDISSSYLLLAKIYFEIGQPSDIEALLQTIPMIPGSQKEIIDRKLKEFCQSHDLLHF
jgi:hypothetical protein